MNLYRSYYKNSPCVGDVTPFRTVEMLSNQIHYIENSYPLYFSDEYEPKKPETTFTRGEIILDARLGKEIDFTGLEPIYNANGYTVRYYRMKKTGS